MSTQSQEREKTKELFNLTFFGQNLTPTSGEKIWNDGSVAILNQPSYQLNIPINWLDDPYNHRSWRWILNAFQWMDKLLSEFKFNNDESAIKKCANYFFDWARFYITEGNEGEFLWKDDAVSFRALRLSIISDYILKSETYNEDEKLLTLKILKMHYLELSNPKKFKKNNHGIFQMRALMSLLTVHPYIGDIEEAKNYVAEKLNWLWTKQYGQQNMHLENSTGYHQYIIEEFIQIIKSPELKNIDFIFDEKIIKEVKENTKFLFHPNGVGTLFGDSNFVKQNHNTVIGDHLFNEAGYAVLAGSDDSENNSYLVIRTGFPSNAHRHSDDFTFEWSEKGQIIFQDSGRYSYDYNNPYRLFVSSSRAHNTVTVNNTNFPWWGDFNKSDFYSGAISSYHGNSDRAALELSKEFKSLDINFNRTFEVERGKSLIVTDILTSSAENTYEQWFHLAEDFDYLGTNKNGTLAFESEKIKLEVVYSEDTELMIAKGQEDDFLQGWISYSEKKIIPRWSFGFKSINKVKNFKFKTKFIVF